MTKREKNQIKKYLVQCLEDFEAFLEGDLVHCSLFICNNIVFMNQDNSKADIALKYIKENRHLVPESRYRHKEPFWDSFWIWVNREERPKLIKEKIKFLKILIHKLEMTERLDKSMDIVLKSYKERDLMYGDCGRCVVGQIIKYSGKKVDGRWYMLSKERPMGKNDILEGEKQIKASGYTAKELKLISDTFEATSVISIVDCIINTFKVMFEIDKCEADFEEVLLAKCANLKMKTKFASALKKIKASKWQILQTY